MTKRRRSGGGFGGPPGGGGVPNQASLMRQLQKMQEDMETAQEELADEKIEVSVGGGALTVVVNGHQQVQSVTINPDVINTEDEEWLTDLQDLLVAAMNQAIEQSQALHNERMSGLTGGLESMLPGGLGGLLG
jgi:DNA-binding YbaB/EbfC family protein